MESINPATGELIRTYTPHTDEQVTAAIEKAHQTFVNWRTTSFAHRAELIRKAARVMRERSEKLARLMCDEMGKVLRDGRAEVEKCAWCSEYYADNAEKFLGPEDVASDASHSYVRYDPLGVVLAVMPWNFPLWQVIRFASPALMAGNVGILKHASNVSGSALAIQEIYEEAGLPAGAFTTLLIESRRVASVIAHPFVKAITLTGSTPAGQAVAAESGRHLKKTVLELGGSDPYLILSDADLDLAADASAKSRLINAGQSCIAAKRFIVVKQHRKAFEERFVERFKKVRFGDPTSDSTDMGPQARHDLRDELHDQVTRSIAAGAVCLIGGEIPDSKGAFYPPTILTNVTRKVPSYTEELFGPVASIIEAADDDDAVRIANDSPFGLGAALFTRDRAKADRLAQQVESGSVFVNTFVKSDPRLPFGGVKESGYGRELSAFGIREFVNIKTVFHK